MVERSCLCVYLFVLGVVCMVLGSVLLFFYSVNFDYRCELVQYGEFWSMLRTGSCGDTFLSDNVSDPNFYMYALTYDDPNIPGNVTRIINSNKSFYMFFGVGIYVGVPDPNSMILCNGSKWQKQYHWSLPLHIQEIFHQLYLKGLSTPHNTTIHKLIVKSKITANADVFSCVFFNLENLVSSRTGFLIRGVFEVTYDNLSDSLTFYLANYSVESGNYSSVVKSFNFNETDLLKFETWVEWNFTFSQKYGSDAKHAGQGFLSRWTIRKENNNVVLNISYYTYFLGPVPTYTVLLRIPFFESGITVLGGILTICVTHRCKKLPISVRNRRKIVYLLSLLSIVLGITYFVIGIISFPGYIFILPYLSKLTYNIGIHRGWRTFHT